MSSLPTRSDIAGTPSNASAKAFLASLFDFVAQRMARGTSGAGAATATELASARDSLGVPQVNWLYNPDGAVYQRAVVATADDTYAEDRWYALTQTASVTPSQQSNPENGYRHASRLAQSQAVAQRMGYAQIIEGKDAIPMRGKTMTFGGRFKLSTSANLRMAILAWTGTEDTVTSDVVNDWTNGTFSTGAFFASSNLSLVATSATALTAATAADASVTGPIPVGATNVIVVYWTEAAAAQNVTLDAWGRRLIESAYLNDHIRRSHAEELARCQRFGRPAPQARMIIYNVTSAAIAVPVSFAPMRTTPSTSGLTYAQTNTSGATFSAIATDLATLSAIVSASGAGDVQVTGGFLSAEL